MGTKYNFALIDTKYDPTSDFSTFVFDFSNIPAKSFGADSDSLSLAHSHILDACKNLGSKEFPQHLLSPRDILAYDRAIERTIILSREDCYLSDVRAASPEYISSVTHTKSLVLKVVAFTVSLIVVVGLLVTLVWAECFNKSHFKFSNLLNYSSLEPLLGIIALIAFFLLYCLVQSIKSLNSARRVSKARVLINNYYNNRITMIMRSLELKKEKEDTFIKKNRDDDGDGDGGDGGGSAPVYDANIGLEEPQDSEYEHSKDVQAALFDYYSKSPRRQNSQKDAQVYHNHPHYPHNPPAYNPGAHNTPAFPPPPYNLQEFTSWNTSGYLQNNPYTAPSRTGDQHLNNNNGSR